MIKKDQSKEKFVFVHAQKTINLIKANGQF